MCSLYVPGSIVKREMDVMDQSYRQQRRVTQPCSHYYSVSESCQREVSEDPHAGIIPKLYKCGVSSILRVNTDPLSCHCEANNTESNCFGVESLRCHQAERGEEGDDRIELVPMPDAGSMLHRCDHCEKQYKCQKNELRHVQVHHRGTMPYRCMFCTLTFKTNTSFDRHVQKRHQNEKFYPCTFCEASFSAVGQLLSHVHTHTIEKPYKCNGCNKGFIASASLQRHESKCDRLACRHKDNFNSNTCCSNASIGHSPCRSKHCCRCIPRHIKQDCDSHPHLNACCSDIIPCCSEKLSRDHISRCIEGNREAIRCRSGRHCSSEYETANSHFSFSCSCCRLTFSRIGTLNCHLSIHGGSKLFKCRLCEQAFESGSRLRRHLLKHSGNWCGAGLLSSSLHLLLIIMQCCRSHILITSLIANDYAHVQSGNHIYFQYRTQEFENGGSGGRKSPSGFRGRAPAASDVWCFVSQFRAFWSISMVINVLN